MRKKVPRVKSSENIFDKMCSAFLKKHFSFTGEENIPYQQFQFLITYTLLGYIYKVYQEAK